MISNNILQWWPRQKLSYLENLDIFCTDSFFNFPGIDFLFKQTISTGADLLKHYLKKNIWIWRPRRLWSGQWNIPETCQRQCDHQLGMNDLNISRPMTGHLSSILSSYWLKLSDWLTLPLTSFLRVQSSLHAAIISPCPLITNIIRNYIWVKTYYWLCYTNFLWNADCWVQCFENYSVQFQWYSRKLEATELNWLNTFLLRILIN